MTPPTVRRAARIFLSSWLAAACGQGRQAAAPEPGTELYAVAPASIDEVVLSSPDRKMLAFRWAPDTVFQLVFAARGRPETERCAAGDGFRRWLTAVSSMPVDQRLERPFEPAGAGWVHLRLRDTTQIGPIDVRLRIPSAGDEPVVIQAGEHQYRVNVDAAVLRTIESACRGVGAAAAGGR
jgi:hypothetical protein